MDHDGSPKTRFWHQPVAIGRLRGELFESACGFSSLIWVCILVYFSREIAPMGFGSGFAL